MRKGNPGDVLAQADFMLKGTGYNGPVSEIVHAELYVSGAFDYGNGTGMVFEYSGSPMPVSFDTRYDNVTPENFREFAYQVLRNRTVDTVKVEMI